MYCLSVLICAAATADAPRAANLRVGIVGLDTSHSIDFTRIINGQHENELQGLRVVAAYPYGSRTIESSVTRIPLYTQQIQEMGVEIVDSIEKLIGLVDAVLLETNDGRLHLEQVLPLLRAGKPTFVDKPMAASLTDVLLIFDAAKHFRTPLFSASALRYGKDTLAVRNGAIGEIVGCDTSSPCFLEATHPDLFWYGIHGVESLYTVMGKGCESVQRVSSRDSEIVVGTWTGGRLGTFRGMRVSKKRYGGMAFGQEANQSVGQYEGYEPLLIDIASFFRTGKASVTPAETIEIYAFMQAAQESKALGGQAVSVQAVLAKAKKQAAAEKNW